MKQVSALALCLVLCGAPHALASPVVGTSANTLPQGEFMIDLWSTWQSYDREYADNLHGDGNPGWEDLPGDITYTSASFVPRLLYGVTDWLTLRVSLPLEDRFRDFPDAEGQATSTGLGDVIVDPKILLYAPESGATKVSLLAGVRFPTGDTTSDVPLSDGSTDFGVGFAWTQKMGDVTGHVCSFYWVNGESEDGIDVRNQSTTTLTIEDPLNADWSLLWEARAWLGEDATKFYRIAACPGVSWNASQRLNVGFSGVISVAAKGCPLITRYDSSWSPYLRAYYRFY
jgi:hypothetical protein